MEPAAVDGVGPESGPANFRVGSQRTVTGPNEKHEAAKNHAKSQIKTPNFQGGDFPSTRLHCSADATALN